MSARQPTPTCVFCGREIAPDEPFSGRPPMAAHASCADAALADDRHWDELASATGGADVDSPEAQPAERGRGAGCLSVLAMVTALTVLLVLVM